MVQFECPRHWNPSVSSHPFLELGEFPFLIISPLDELGPQYESEKVGNFPEQNWLKGLQIVQFECPRHWNPSASSIFEVGRISLFPLLALWGNKNGLPSMKVKKLKIFQNKMGLKGCKWSSLNAPGTETPLPHPYWKLQEFPFSHY